MAGVKALVVRLLEILTVLAEEFDFAFEFVLVADSWPQGLPGFGFRHARASVHGGWLSKLEDG